MLLTSFAGRKFRGDKLTGDLHCHTKKSDGSVVPCEVVKLAARLGLSCIAITDHDTMDGVSEAQKQSEISGVKIIPGIEVSTYDYKHEKKVHILCYMPKKPQSLIEFCSETLRRRTKASLEMIEKVKTRYPVDLETVKKYAGGSTAVYKQHIALALMNMGYSLTVFGEFYASLFSSSKPGWALVETKLPETREAFKVVKESGGAAVLAHPGVYGNFDIVDELCAMGLDGIKVFHSRQSEEDTKKALEAARRYNLLRTGGSDFHGMTASKVTPLGTKTAESGQLEKLLEKFG